VSLKLFDVAPEIGEQALPALVHACQTYEYPVGLLLQTPVLALKVLPCCAVPLMPGAPVTTGAAGKTGPTVPLVAGDADPPAFEAATDAVM
jgi:hypothetical protein